MINKGYHPLPASLRNLLKKPFGELVPDSKVSKEKISSSVPEDGIIVSIGDRTSERMREFRIFSNLEVVDGIEKRAQRTMGIPTFLGDSSRLLHAVNPAGGISDDSIEAIRTSLELISSDRKKSVRLEIDGEEDLLALPVLAFFPRAKTIVLYGQPNEGLVIARANQETSEQARSILAMMGIII